MRLGEWLVQRGTITVEQLESALRAQVMYGARLGTNLIEQGAILDLDVVSQALAERAGLPPTLQKHLQSVDPAAVALVPQKLAAKYGAIPLGFTRSTPRRLAVAFIDPFEPGAVQEISMLTGLEVLPSVACELRIHYYLERIYGIPRHNRYVRVEEAVARHRDASERRRFVEAFPSIALDEVPAPAAAPVPAPAAAPAAPVVVTPAPAPAPAPPPPAPSPVVQLPPVAAAAPSRLRAMSGTWDIVRLPDPVPAAPPPLVKAPPRLPLGADAAIAAITSAAGREVLGDRLVDFLRGGFGGGIVFVVRKGMALGWKGFVRDFDDPVIDAIALPLSQPSVVQIAHASGAICRGAPPPEGAILNGLLWKALRVPPPRQVAVAPIAVQGRIVCIVYGHPVDGGEISDATIAELDRVCAAASAAFARLIIAAR